MKVKDVMNGTLFHTDKDETLAEVMRLLHEYNADAIIVRNNGIPEGMITARDIVRFLAINNKDPKEITAKEVMTTPIPSIDFEADLDSAKALMQTKRINNVPVKMEFDIIGLLTSIDLL